MNGTLTGLKVIELAAIGPVPFAAMMMADMGAEIIRIDRIPAASGSGDSSPTFENRGRISVSSGD